METLVDEAWSQYWRADGLPYIVRPSLPILYFGDRDRYLRSPLKVITVGLNPSHAEFPASELFRRFRKAEHLNPRIVEGDFYARYIGALNDYFRCDPYMSWFGAFERLLQGMNAGFRDGRLNTALHTDVCSPLATNPTWSKLTGEREALGPPGARLWIDLARLLAPDVILISVARRYLDDLDLRWLGDWEVIHTVERRNPYVVESRAVEVAPGKRSALVFGRAYQTPFGAVNGHDKFEIGRRVAEWVDRHGAVRLRHRS